MLQAAEEFDAGDIWASREFAVGDRPKSALYRGEAADAAVEAVLEAIDGFRDGTLVPEPLDYTDVRVEGRLERPMKRADRVIDWTASTLDVLRRLRCSDSTPGVLDTIFGQTYHLFGGHAEGVLRGRPGDVLGYRDASHAAPTVSRWRSPLRMAAFGATRLP